MPDIDIVCTSSTERDLRFYDTVAKKFDLRVMVELEFSPQLANLIDPRNCNWFADIQL